VAVLHHRREDTKGHSLLAGKPQVANRRRSSPWPPGASGALRVSWRLVGVDAHPVIGAYVFGVGAGAGGGGRSRQRDPADGR